MVRATSRTPRRSRPTARASTAATAPRRPSTRATAMATGRPATRPATPTALPARRAPTTATRASSVSAWPPLPHTCLLLPGPRLGGGSLHGGHTVAPGPHPPLSLPQTTVGVAAEAAATDTAQAAPRTRAPTAATAAARGVPHTKANKVGREGPAWCSQGSHTLGGPPVQRRLVVVGCLLLMPATSGYRNVPQLAQGCLPSARQVSPSWDPSNAGHGLKPSPPPPLQKTSRNCPLGAEPSGPPELPRVFEPGLEPEAPSRCGL